MRSLTVLFSSLALVLLSITSCSVLSSDDGSLYKFDQTGTLKWMGSPAADGLGMLFRPDGEDVDYGVPGGKSDYPSLFFGEENSVRIKADIQITGDSTVRGWGATFEEALIVNPVRL